MEKVKLRKVGMLDVQWGSPKMPEHVKRSFFDCARTGANDVWVAWRCSGHGKVTKWLLENTDTKYGDTVMLKHWW
jgi:hypothetical protein